LYLTSGRGSIRRRHLEKDFGGIGGRGVAGWLGVGVAGCRSSAVD
jgi:hypothetical protein